MSRDNDDNPYRAPRIAASRALTDWSAPSVNTADAIYMTGEFTFDHCRRAVRLLSPWRRTASGLFGLACLFGYIGVALWSASDLGKAGRLYALAAICTLFTAIMIGRQLWRRYAAARQTWRNHENMPIRRWISTDAIRTDTPLFSATVSWNSFGRHIEADGLILVENTSFNYEIFPRSHCKTDADWDAFVALVKNKTRRA
jgi:hypothetical protein